MLSSRQQAKVFYYAAADALKEQRARGREILRLRGITPKVFLEELKKLVNIPGWYKMSEYEVYLTYCEQIDLNADTSIAQFAWSRFGGLTIFVNSVKLTWAEAGLISEDEVQI